jgi:hypothetical protein
MGYLSRMYKSLRAMSLINKYFMGKVLLRLKYLWEVSGSRASFNGKDYFRFGDYINDAYGFSSSTESQFRTWATYVDSSNKLLLYYNNINWTSFTITFKEGFDLSSPTGKSSDDKKRYPSLLEMFLINVSEFENGKKELNTI